MNTPVVAAIAVASVVVGAVLWSMRRAAMVRALDAGTGHGYSITGLFVALGVLFVVAVVLVNNDVAMKDAVVSWIGGKR